MTKPGPTRRIPHRVTRAAILRSTGCPPGGAGIAVRSARGVHGDEAAGRQPHDGLLGGFRQSQGDRPRGGLPFGQCAGAHPGNGRAGMPGPRRPSPGRHGQERHRQHEQVHPSGQQGEHGAHPTEQDRTRCGRGALPGPSWASRGSSPVPASGCNLPEGASPREAHGRGSAGPFRASRAVGVGTLASTSWTMLRPVTALIHSSGLTVTRWARTGTATTLTSSGVT